MKGNKLFKAGSDIPQNEKEDGNQESDSLRKRSINIEKKVINKGTRDTGGGNPKEEDDQIDYVPSEHVAIGKFACNETFYKACNLMRSRWERDDST